MEIVSTNSIMVGMRDDWSREKDGAGARIAIPLSFFRKLITYRLARV